MTRQSETKDPKKELVSAILAEAGKSLLTRKLGNRVRKHLAACKITVTYDTEGTEDLFYTITGLDKLSERELRILLAELMMM